MALTLVQQLHRLRQQGKDSWGFATMFRQFDIIKKLYARYGFEISMTGSACPEQYEVFKDGKQVAYYRLRHGEFTVESPDCGGKLLLNESPDGDGMFEGYERFNYISKALRKLLEQ